MANTKKMSKQLQRCWAIAMLISHCFYSSPPSWNQFKSDCLDSIQYGSLKANFIQLLTDRKSRCRIPLSRQALNIQWKLHYRTRNINNTITRQNMPFVIYNSVFLFQMCHWCLHRLLYMTNIDYCINMNENDPLVILKELNTNLSVQAKIIHLGSSVIQFESSDAAWPGM